MNEDIVVVDAKDAVLGRIGSYIAKNALQGKKVIVLNSEQIVINGSRQYIIEDFITRRNWKNKANPEHSPKFPRVPHMLVKRLIRGMLPYKSSRGKEAYKRIKVYTGVPEEFSKVSSLRIEKALKKSGSKYIKILDICKYFGYSR